MTEAVVDPSGALAWCFPGESGDYAEAVLVALDGKRLLTPSIWGLEVANAVLVGLVGERAERLAKPGVQAFIAFLSHLAVKQDASPALETLRTVLPLARSYSLSACDAAYLEFAIRQGAPLATLNRNLHRAATKARVPLFLTA